MVTVHDVAERSGVSIATVSRTLRAPHRVSEATRERVLSAIHDLGYRPNRAARNLREGRTGAIGLIVPDIANPYFGALTKGVQALARARGYGLFVVDTAEQADVESEEIASFRAQVDGMILASSRLTDDDLAEAAAAMRCVLVNRALDDGSTPTVTTDETSGADTAVAHLVELGHRRIAYVGGPDTSWTEDRRSRELARAADSAGVELVTIGSFTPDAAGGRAAAAGALDADASAIIAFNSLIALGLQAEWARRGIHAPEDVSLLGFDDTDVADLAASPLTTVGADLRELGERAVATLLDRFETETAASPAPLEMHLTARASTGRR